MRSSDVEAQSKPGAVIPTDVAENPWPYATRTFQALDYRFAVRSADALLVRLLDRLYGACAASGDPDLWYSVAPVDPDAREKDLFVGANRIARFAEPYWLMRYLTWHVNRQAIAQSSRFVLLHAAVAEKQGAGVLLPAASESGKTTLIAGLIRSGFGYLTDEAAAIDPRTLLIEPYPKPLTIDPGSWSILPELAPQSDSDTGRFFEGQWQVNADSVRSDAVSGRVKPALVVFPRYSRGARLDVEPIARSEALVLMLRHTFAVHDAGRRNFEVLGRILPTTKCYRMVSGDLEEACAVIGALLTEEIAEEESG